ncbi:hypothetical protein M728_005695 (plasmid) [Ensifer sp. WSM1721]|uniref:AlbA family DNA-binding domain-containing protein n=1 Tax=Ensifer sp. WSM1721 TaxID=1041159 RepID=UPI001FD912A1|nr:ATP-binding protein [Ensifer sp. WSM1721]
MFNCIHLISLENFFFFRCAQGSKTAESDIRGIKRGHTMPIHDPCALLNRLLEEPNESAWLEFKVNNKDPREIGEYVSALANSAMLAGRDRAFLVFGVEDRTRRRVGTELRLQQQKQGNEDFTNWLT